jgi:hypothetical protein
VARICVDSTQFEVDAGGVLHIKSTFGGLRQLLTFTTPGSFNFDKTIYPGLRSIRVRAIGGGAGGAGANADTGETIVRTGGSGAGYSESVFLASALANITTVVVGSGGAGGVGNEPGDPGAASTFGGTVSAPGGIGGTIAQNSGTSVNAVGGVAGPTAGSGQIRIGGGPSGIAIRNGAQSGVSGGGGDSGGAYGLGATPRGSEGDGFAPRGFGGGGGGAVSFGASNNGSAGTGGAVFIELFF